MAEALHLADFGMDTVSLAGPLAAKLAAIRGAGFGRVTLDAGELVAHRDGFDAAVREVRASGLEVAALRALRGFEGLEAPFHEYRVDVARSMIEMCAALGGRVLLASSSTDPHASGDRDHIARDLRKLATMAIPSGIRVAYESLSWARHVRDLRQAWEVVERADCPNLGLGLDSYHSFASDTPLEVLDEIDVERIFLVQLSDFLWPTVATTEERIATAQQFRVFPGEGAHSEALQRLVVELDRLGYRGGYSFDVCNADYLQLPRPTVAERARRSAVWLAEDVLRRAVPLPHQLLLPRGGGPVRDPT
jgi:sugar phosphate isomerase/epimerase